MTLPGPIQRALDWLRVELPKKLRDLPERVDPRVAWGLGGVLAAVLLVLVLSALLGGDDAPKAQTKVVTVSVETDDAADAPVGALGFPVVATRNTTRVGGEDAATDAAAIALATHPPSPSAPPVEAAILVPPGDWQAGVAAAVLSGPPVGAPVLIGDPSGVPEPTADALAKLDPQGSGPGDAAVYVVGDVAAPAGYGTAQVEGGSPAQVANQIDQLRQTLVKSDPEHILVASAEQAEYAMPAAAWAARSGDPVLFSDADEVPEETIEALRRHRQARVYVLGPDGVISPRAVRQMERVTPGIQRIGADDPVENAIAFARYADAGFGWDINDPGHGLVVASAARPDDAGPAAALSASGKWGPLLLVDDAGTLPPALRSFLLDIKPGFEDDPTRAVYNHVWLVGDTSAVGASVQAEIDELAELAEVGPGAGGPVSESGGSGTSGLGLTGGSEPEPQPGQRGGGQ